MGRGTAELDEEKGETLLAEVGVRRRVFTTGGTRGSWYRGRVISAGHLHIHEGAIARKRFPRKSHFLIGWHRRSVPTVHGQKQLGAGYLVVGIKNGNL